MQFESGAPGRNRTYDSRIRNPVLYPLSYEGTVNELLSSSGVYSKISIKPQVKIYC